MEAIVIRGARQHNLKNISIEIPRKKLVVLTGVSGSGKTSLAFDTIFAEGQRRYVESLSVYARQFLAQMPKPLVDSIDGLSPAIAIDQKNAARNPRSTVGTITEINDHLRLLYAHAGTPHCPDCGKEVTAQTVQQMVDLILRSPEGRRLSLLAPVVRDRKGSFAHEFKTLRKEGFVRVRFDGEVRELDEEIKVDSRKKHTLEVFVDRIVCKEKVRARLTDSLETALKMGKGLVRIVYADGEEVLFSEQFSCPDCGISLPEMEPRLFSFNNPAGACPGCAGLGYQMVFVPDRVIADPELSIKKGAITPWSKRGSKQQKSLQSIAKSQGIDLDIPWKDLDKKSQDLILFGTSEKKKKGSVAFEGVLPWLDRRLTEFQRKKRDEGSSEDDLFDRVADEFHKYMDRSVCEQCQGLRLRREALAVTVGEKNIAEISSMTIETLIGFFSGLDFDEKTGQIIERVHREIDGRLGFLCKVGVEYLTLNRSAATLSGGEAQRIRLATQIGSSLVGVLYVLDEPSIGLHQRDNEKLLTTLRDLRDRGNTVIVVEHDRDTIQTADWVVDIGPGAGTHGGQIVAEGTPDQVVKQGDSLTGGYLSGKLDVPIPKKRREPGFNRLFVKGAAQNNLKKIDVEIPLGLFVCITGVSGSGKSSLITDTLIPELKRVLHKSRGRPGDFVSIEGIENIDKVVAIDQSPIGRSPRSNPATYSGVFNPIRELFAGLPDAKAKGYGQSRFSFNVKGGRCEACQGDGLKRVEMHFLPDLFVLCDQCHGQRYNRETLEIAYKGKNIAEILDLTIDEAALFFENIPSVRKKLSTLQSVGLGYIKLGQSATTLSGGEAQRTKLSRELSKRSTGRTLYMLDEPTTGLHFEDVRKLLEVLSRLVRQGNTVLVIEHNLDMIKCADWVIDLGPEGGEGGGTIVAQGPPEKIASNKNSHTGQFLRKLLKRRSRGNR